jgi:peptidoglycan-N-acetylglucosamine deacetylase
LRHVITRKSAIAVAICGLFIAGGATLWHIGNSHTFQFFGVVVPRVASSEKVVALTFDDGPTASGTDSILKILEEKGVKATFFVIGTELEHNMPQGRKIAAAGHELGNHSYSHARMILVTPGFVQQEVERTDELIREAGYSGEIMFRPPFGKKLFVLPYFLAQTRRTTVTWDVEGDSNPGMARDATKIVDLVRSRVRPGSIILLHAMYPNRRESLKAIAGIVDSLHVEGYRFVTVSELLRTAQ